MGMLYSKVDIIASLMLIPVVRRSRHTMSFESTLHPSSAACGGHCQGGWHLRDKEFERQGLAPRWLIVARLSWTGWHHSPIRRWICVNGAVVRLRSPVQMNPYRSESNRRAFWYVDNPICDMLPRGETVRRHIESTFSRLMMDILSWMTARQAWNGDYA
ncbi:hypothetical protein BDV28DRAFT_150284 [Aspergillus coremiiformis]|uniref:Uncharacterized protein n=1 Tax=Aspergillus coremiiformis TaxID=138285 RepID=A0A5N6Z125_9EURO|nr:hypothetical protein BDV28DRAFT_150284 [Aspergillus coremiiformis]